MKQGSVIVIPARNEAATIRDVAESVLRAGVSCVVVDDASEDNTWRLARDAGAAVVRLAEPMGVGAATMAGLAWAKWHGARYATTMDGDGQHQIEDCLRVHAAIAQGGSLIVGDRFAAPRGVVPETKRVANQLAAAVVGGIARRRPALRDVSCGLRSYDLVCISLPKHPLGYGWLYVTLIQALEAGRKVISVPVEAVYPEATSGTAVTELSQFTDALVEILPARHRVSIALQRVVSRIAAGEDLELAYQLSDGAWRYAYGRRVLKQYRFCYSGAWKLPEGASAIACR